MAKKLRSFRVLSCTLAVLATLAFIIACGEGQVIEIVQSKMADSEGNARGNYSSILANMPSYTQSSSSEEEQPPASSSSEDISLSSGEQPSSASLPDSSVSSSQSAEPSSSSESPYTLSCKILPANSTFPVGVKIPVERRPELKCIEKNGNVIPLDNDLDVGKWTNNPAWNGPSALIYDNILVKVERDDKGPCHGLEVKCEGTITISAPSSSSYSPPPPPSNSSSSPSTTSSSSKASSASTTPSSSSAASGGGACSSNETRGNMCLWNAGGDCWPLNSSERDNCGKNAWIFQGGTEGAGTACSGGTFICGKNNSPPTGSAASLGCCKWETETKCWDVYTTQEKTDCSGGSNRFWNQNCPNKDGGCPN